MELKRYAVLLFTKKIDFILPSIEKHIYKETPLYQTFNILDTSFINFFSVKTLSEIKAGLSKDHPKNVFLIFNTSERGHTFDMYFDKTTQPDVNKMEDLFLIENLNKETFETQELDLNDLLDLVNKNGWKSLTENQKKRLQDFSND